ncbi:MAG: phospholipase D-like domain-containing protein [Candidatus Saccharibacteria bacterium]|nr:phospholipase D-like domain-containing protein [Candidatus Saccharibacteria bacterium]
MKLLTTSDYIADASEAIARSKKRVIVMTLCISRESGTEEFMDNLVIAAKKGVDVSIAADTFTFSAFGGYFSPFKRLHHNSRAAKKLANKLRSNGAEFRWLGGNWRINPFAGVTHVKWTIVDDTIYCFGGVNMYGKGAKNTDYMFKVRDGKLADLLANEHKKIVQTDRDPTDYSGFYRQLGYGNLLIDSGQKNESMIYERAVELAQQSQSILFVSQYCPTGKLAKVLRYKKAVVYYNQPKNSHRWTNIMLRYSRLTTGLKSRYKKQNYLHGKFIVFTMHDGSKVALTGSHNFSYSGVRLGTREVELETNDKKVISQLENFYKDNIT